MCMLNSAGRICVRRRKKNHENRDYPRPDWVNGSRRKGFPPKKGKTKIVPPEPLDNLPPRVPKKSKKSVVNKKERKHFDPHAKRPPSARSL
jgi:hypothetical protein